MVMQIGLNMNFRDEKILEWLSENGTTQTTLADMATRYNCSQTTIWRLLKSFKVAGYIECDNRRRGGIIITAKAQQWHENLH